MDQYSDGTWHGNAKSKAGFAGSQMQRYLDWDYLKEVRDIWNGPIILKGLMHVDDAIKASKIVDAIYLSNHGGRQIDIAQVLFKFCRNSKKIRTKISYYN